MAQQTEKWIQYACRISQQISEMFDDECDNFIDRNELSKDKNLEAFIYALGVAVPCSVFNKFTGNQEDHLGFNHIANRLILQNSKCDSETEPSKK